MCVCVCVCVCTCMCACVCTHAHVSAYVGGCIRMSACYVHSSFYTNLISKLGLAKIGLNDRDRMSVKALNSRES